MRASIGWWLVAACGGDPEPAKDRPDDTDLPADTDVVRDTDPPATTGETADTGDTGVPAEPSPYADCVATRTDSTGAITTYEYDGDGRMRSMETDRDGDGFAEQRNGYTWILYGGVVVESEVGSTDGTLGHVWYDEHGHIEQVDVGQVGGGPATSSTFTNTHDAAGVLTHSVMVTSGSTLVVTSDYGECERWTRQEIDLFGDGSSVTVSTATYVFQPVCLPTESVVTGPGGETTYTWAYDDEGRLLEETMSGNPPYSASWGWDCPGV